MRTEEVEATASLEIDIEKFVTSRVNDAVLMESVGQEMVFQLPAAGMQSFGHMVAGVSYQIA